MMRTPEIYIFLFLLLLFGHTASGGIKTDTSSIVKHSFDKEKWQKLSRDIDYSGEQAPRIKSARPFNFSMNQDLAKLILFSGVGILLLYFLVRILKGNYINRNKKIKPSEDFIALSPEDNIHAADLENQFAKALKDQNLREAIRLKYLMAIRELSKHNLIRWKKDKTNHDYLFETFQTGLYVTFAQVTNLFERFWYGEAEINEVKFQNTLSVFETFLQSIGSVNQPEQSQDTSPNNSAANNE